MRYGSVCSGIEAASVAWKPLGWECAFVSEIDPFCCQVLYRRLGASRPLVMPQPDEKTGAKARRRMLVDAKAVRKIPEAGTLTNHGDFRSITDASETGDIDILVGGPPCVSFSVAGLRGGLADPRGNMAIEFIRLVGRLRPRWFVFENVPGLLSSNGGRDFGTLLGEMGKLGYGFAYRVLNAEHFGVPQRRRRVFVVGHLGGWRGPAAVLFERHGLSRNPPPSRQARSDVTSGLTRSLGSGGADAARAAANHLVASPVTGRSAIATDSACTTTLIPDVAKCLTSSRKGGTGYRSDLDTETFIAHTLRAEGFDGSEVCSIPDCGKRPHAGGFCSSHYNRFKRHGDPLAGRVNEGEPLEFLLSHVGHDSHECLLWPYAKLATGYGSVEYGGKTVRVHRLMCEKAHGEPSPPDLDAAHSCGNRLCINPKHLRWATRSENMGDAIEHGTTTRGERHGLHKLKEDDVRGVLDCLSRGETHESISVKYGVSRNAITDIANGKNWAWLSGKKDEDGTGRGIPRIPVAYQCHGSNEDPQVFQTRIARNGRGQPKDVVDALTSNEDGGHADTKPHIFSRAGVRRLTPLEFDRLQGFTDNWTLIPVKRIRKPTPAVLAHFEAERRLGYIDGEPWLLAADGPRYRVTGNSMAVPCMTWIGQRIEMVDRLMKRLGIN